MGNNNTGYIIEMVIKLCNICEKCREVDRQRRKHRKGMIERNSENEREREKRRTHQTINQATT